MKIKPIYTPKPSASSEGKHKALINTSEVLDEAFILSTRPTQNKTGMAKIQPCRGVKINQIYYWCEAMRDPEVEKTKVDVRYVPSNFGIAFAFIKGRWEKCMSEHFDFLNHRTESDIQAIVKEYKNRSKFFRDNARAFIGFYQKIISEEDVMRQKKDGENAVVNEEINFIQPSSTHQAAIHNGCDVHAAVETDSVGSTPETQAPTGGDNDNDTIGEL